MNTEHIGTATYSPEDNKLRLTAFHRLPRELYDRVRAAGYIWAPKQEIFVAPMWTPDREDLALELCGEIADEDKSLVQRADERAERFEGYGQSRADEAAQAHKAVESICEHIPLGQPILVGHHSERHARRDAERIESTMRRAVKAFETSQYWIDRAASAVSHAKYLERPDVRARRIKKIEAEKRKQERAQQEAQNLVRFWSGETFAINRATGEKRRVEITEDNRAFLHEVLGRMSGSGVNVLGVDGQNYYTAWDVTAPDGERYQNCPVKTVLELQESALRLQSRLIAHCNRWIAHFDNRLLYERAMLAASGGTATDKTGPETGGACKCWASVRGCWSYIQKVNKVSVTVLDNWGNGGGNFTRTIPFDKCRDVMTKAQVDQAREAGRLVETQCKTGFGLCGDDTAKKAVETSDERNARCHQDAVASSAARNQKQPAKTVIPDEVKAVLQAATLTADSVILNGHIDRSLYLKVNHVLELAGGTWNKSRKAHIFTQRPADVLDIGEGRLKADAMTFDAMKQALKAGVQVIAAPQLFPTPPAVAARVVELADIRDGQRILEPSAGTGNLLRALGDVMAGDFSNVCAVEINSSLVANLTAGWPKMDTRRMDFLTCNGELGLFDRIVMNPPFEHGADIKHIRHALEHLAHGGRLVAICAASPRQREAFETTADEWIDLEPGTFKESGTMVNAAIVVFSK